MHQIGNSSTLRFFATKVFSDKPNSQIHLQIIKKDILKRILCHNSPKREKIVLSFGNITIMHQIIPNFEIQQKKPMEQKIEAEISTKFCIIWAHTHRHCCYSISFFILRIFVCLNQSTILKPLNPMAIYRTCVKTNLNQYQSKGCSFILYYKPLIM